MIASPLLPKGVCVGWDPLLVYGIAGSELIFALCTAAAAVLILLANGRRPWLPLTLARAVFAATLALCFLTKTATMWWAAGFWFNLGADLLGVPAAVACVIIMAMHKGGGGD
jgi:hypothetical protein